MSIDRDGHIHDAYSVTCGNGYVSSRYDIFVNNWRLKWGEIVMADIFEWVMTQDLPGRGFSAMVELVERRRAIPV
jgi:hypothetical protein